MKVHILAILLALVCLAWANNAIVDSESLDGRSAGDIEVTDWTTAQKSGIEVSDWKSSEKATVRRWNGADMDDDQATNDDDDENMTLAEKDKADEAKEEKEKLKAKLQKSHGILMGIACVVLMPLGALIMRVFSFRNLIWVHAGWQIVSFVILMGGFATGFWLAQVHGEMLDNTHTILGTVLLVLFWFQPFLGLIHHKQYKVKGRRTAWSTGHVWWGRILIFVAIINGGLGLQLASNSVKGEKAWTGMSSGLFAIYVIILVWWHLKGGYGSKAQEDKVEGEVEHVEELKGKE